MLLWRGPEPLHDQPLPPPDRPGAVEPAGSSLQLGAARGGSAGGGAGAAGGAASAAGDGAPVERPLPWAAADPAAAAAGAAPLEAGPSPEAEPRTPRRAAFAALNAGRRQASSDEPTERPFSELAALSLPECPPADSATQSTPSAPGELAALTDCESPGFGSPVDVERPLSPGSPGSPAARTRSFGSPLELPDGPPCSFRATFQSAPLPAGGPGPAPSPQPEGAERMSGWGTARKLSRWDKRTAPTAAAGTGAAAADVNGASSAAAGNSAAAGEAEAARQEAHRRRRRAMFRRRMRDRRRGGGARAAAAFLGWLLLWGAVLVALSDLSLRNVPGHRCSSFLR